MRLTKENETPLADEIKAAGDELYRHLRHRVEWCGAMKVCEVCGRHGLLFRDPANGMHIIAWSGLEVGQGRLVRDDYMNRPCSCSACVAAGRGVTA